MEFFDTRAAAEAIRQLDGNVLGSSTLRVAYSRPSPADNQDSERLGTGQGFTLGSAAYRTGIFNRSALSTPLSQQRVSETDVFGASRSPFGAQLPRSIGSRFSKHRSLPQNFGPSSPTDEYRSQLHALPPTPINPQATGRRLSEPGLPAGAVENSGMFASGRPGPGMGTRFVNPAQAIPEENRVFPERILSGEL